MRTCAQVVFEPVQFFDLNYTACKSKTRQNVQLKTEKRLTLPILCPNPSVPPPTSSPRSSFPAQILSARYLVWHWTQGIQRFRRCVPVLGDQQCRRGWPANVYQPGHAVRAQLGYVPGGQEETGALVAAWGVRGGFKENVSHVCSSLPVLVDWAFNDVMGDHVDRPLPRGACGRVG